MTRTPVIAGNWKMHGLQAARAEARAIADGVAGLNGAPEVVICPPHTLLADIARDVDGSPVAVGGQDCHWAACGAHTGAVSAPMLADAGARWVILGHSERRAPADGAAGEDDALVRRKAQAAAAAGLNLIVCVGETAAERDAGDAEAVTARQVAQSVPEGGAGAGALCIAYEPVWAIGSGATPTVEQIAAMHAAIRETLGRRLPDTAATAARILYGGSVKPENAAALLAAPGVDGALVGGASLTADAFLKIVQSALLHL